MPMTGCAFSGFDPASDNVRPPAHVVMKLDIAPEPNQALAREAVRGDTVAQHVTQLGAHLEHRLAMSYERE